ncbi:SOS response-associated peptidase [Chryseosolibacter indicus]|uniref:Abasic site processing protein n=1 Tax=Chryseosolibacter indicus TaxID=2782351 RepID=A0ABS5VZ03_9BACT|nr:SOS response-associated peptidase [Chryseosolibacter indicus]MBT1705256.1 SOS response-associated peptidase [Chryseosolibacter indicus]
MIERYTITASRTDLAERFSVDVPDFYKERYNAAPTQLLPVITSSAPEGVSLFYWGISPEWSKNKMVSEKIINVRTESFNDRPALKRALMKTRCLVPADGFYAWKKVGKKTSIPYHFMMADRETFSIAALWEEFEDTEGNQIQTFSIITLPADDIVNNIAERMPVILNRNGEQIWLDKTSGEEKIVDLLKPISASNLNYYPVSPGIANTSLDVASLILPTPPADQHGNLTLFD